MSDFNSSLPVRTQNAGDVIAKIADATTPSQQLAVDSSGRINVKIDDGNGNAVTSQVNGAQRALDVGIDVAGVQIDPRSVGQYNSVLPTVSSGSNTPLQTNSNGVLLTAEAGDQFPATQSITAQDVASTSTAQYNQTWYSGTPTAGSVATFSLSSYETVLVEITGTWTGTLQSEVSVDGGTNWIAHSIHLLGSPIFTSTFTGNVMGSINVAAKTNFRIRSTATWTGTAVVKVNESINPSSVYVANSIKLVDGSSPTSTISMNILAASTAASATNTAIVVALSPNSPLPAGSNNIGSVNQGTSPWIVKDQADGPVTPGTAASFSMLMGGQYNSALPTLASTQQSALQLDSSGRLIIRPLTSADVVTSNQGAPNTLANAWPMEITDGTNKAAVKAASTAAAASDPSLVVALSPNSPVPAGSNTIGKIEITDGTNVVGVAPASTAAVATQPAEVVALSPNTPLPAGTNALGSVLANLQVSNAAVSNTNPVPVTITTSTPGTAIQNYQTSAALAAGSSVTLTYTVAATHTFNLERVWCSASGKIKAVVQNNGSTIFVGFNSTANTNLDITVISPPTIAAGNTVSVIITNLDLAPFDVYATIEGNQN